MTRRENRTKNLANRARALIQELNHSQLGACPPNPEITGLRLTHKSRFAQLGCTQAEMWAADIEPTQSHQVDGENAEVLPWLSVKEVYHASRYSGSTRLLIGFTRGP
jgi:hypothetical protein